MEENIDEINVYVDKLKYFACNGPKNFREVKYQWQETTNLEDTTELGEASTETNTAVSTSESGSEPIEEKMELTAFAGENSMSMTYLKEQAQTEVKTHFQIKENINAVESTSELLCIQENNEYKLELKREDGTYQFKKEEGTTNKFQLNYMIGNVEGEIVIEETIDSVGNLTYKYQITENAKTVTVERGKPDSTGNVGEK